MTYTPPHSNPKYEVWSKVYFWRKIPLKANDHSYTSVVFCGMLGGLERSWVVSVVNWGLWGFRKWPNFEFCSNILRSGVWRIMYGSIQCIVYIPDLRILEKKSKFGHLWNTLEDSCLHQSLSHNLGLCYIFGSRLLWWSGLLMFSNIW